MKRIIIIILSIISIICFMVGLYFYGLTGFTGKNSDDVVSFTIRSGASKKEVIRNLYENKLIKSQIASTIYLYLHPSVEVYPGTYKIKRSMDTPEILDYFKTSEEYHLTFIEGKRFIDYIDQICEAFDFNKEEVLKKLNDKDFLNELIEKYDFLDQNILNSDIYYPLEGYLFPDTYYFNSKSSIEDVITKILDKMKEVLDNYNALIKKSDYNYHDILTIASIIENEAKLMEDKVVVSEVIYKRLDLKMALGMDTTTYYGANKTFGEVLTKEDLDSDNPYNTRNLSLIGLPVGPICNPSEDSIKAALNPSDDDYLYFYTDSNGKLYFAKTYAEHQNNVEKYR